MLGKMRTKTAEVIERHGRKMGVLSHLEPREVFRFFEEICSIPHGSGNVDKISDYLVDFAKERNLEYYQDAVKNVVIIKEATEGYEEIRPLILQGHMDMVAVKTPDCDIDMKKDGLRLAVDGDDIYAEGTSLGGDDGIAVAYSLALLDSKTIPHPRLEVVITTEEETGMDGAREIDLSTLKGHTMLNIDSEEEGYFLASCAGGGKVNCHLPIEREEKSGILYQIAIKGLAGGHSGEEIIKERGNSNCLMGRLFASFKSGAVQLKEVCGGMADNAIPRETTALLLVQPESRQEVLDAVCAFEKDVKAELSTKDPGFYVDIQEKGETVCSVCTVESTERFYKLTVSLPAGIQAMSADMPGLVETSLNMGILTTEETEIEMQYSVRSSIESSKTELVRKMEIITEVCGGFCEKGSFYPGWAFKKESALRDEMTEIYREMYGKEPVVKAIHAGLECGLLSAKIPNLDCVSIGPDMKSIHTTEERLSISSTARVWDFLLEVVKKK